MNPDTRRGPAGVFLTLTLALAGLAGCGAGDQPGGGVSKSFPIAKAAGPPGKAEPRPVGGPVQTIPMH